MINERKIFFILLISLSLEQSKIKRSQRSKHGEDCISNSACEEGLFCIKNRCYTKYELNNLKSLGLLEENICNTKKLCPKNQICEKHRCINKNNSIILPPKNNSFKIDDVHLLFAGGIYLNKNPYLSGINPNQTINYDHLFTHISDYIKNADLSVVSQETPFSIVEGEFTKDFKNTPKELGDAIANAGFKVVLYAGKSAYSKKEKGIIDTLNFWKTKYPDIHPLGISSTIEESQKDYYIFNKNNIKIGIINYSDFDGKSIPTKNKFMVNKIDKKKVEDCVKKLKKEVDFIIACINWGARYSITPNKKEIKWAKILAGFGVNLIIGNHPSNVQPVSYVKAENGNYALVFFSLGNLIAENNLKYNALGALANIIISKENGKTFISSYNLVPTINFNIPSSQYTVYNIIDFNESLGKIINKRFSLEKIKRTCRNIMGAFAHCG